jgi:hypothetical protein
MATDPPWAGSCFFGIRKIESFDLLSNKAVEAFKENLKWKTKPT